MSTSRASGRSTTNYNKGLRTAALFLALLPLGFAQPKPQPGQLDSNVTLYTAFAAFDAAGVSPDAASPSNHPLRKALRNAVLAKNPPVLAEMKTFFVNGRISAGQIVSFALVSTGPPDFGFRLRDLDLPPEVSGMHDLSAMLAKFYVEAEIATLWAQSERAHDQAIARYHEPVSNAVFEANAYLRNFTSGAAKRRFQIYLDLVGPPNQIHARNYGADAFIVITHSAEPQIADVRRAYLTYLIDAAALKHFTAIQKKKALLDYAQAAPALPEHYKVDIGLLVTGSLMRAVEARLLRRPAIAEQALREGFVLTPFFVEQLPAYEKQEQALSLYLLDMVNALDLKKEEARLANVDFVKEAAERRAKLAEQPGPPAPAGTEKTLDDAETFYEKRELDRARTTYTKALTETDNKQLHAKAYYGLARVAILQRDPELGERLFLKALDLAPDPYTKGWVLVYLGRVAHGYGEEDKAAGRYREAMAVDGASIAAKKAAEKGLIESQKEIKK